jgi:hypothetical protein
MNYIVTGQTQKDVGNSKAFHKQSVFRIVAESKADARREAVKLGMSRVISVSQVKALRTRFQRRNWSDSSSLTHW